MEVNLLVKKTKEINDLESYTIADICVLLNCCVRVAKKIKLDILCEKLKEGADIQNTKTYKIPKPDLFSHLERNYKNMLPTKSNIKINKEYLIEDKEEIINSVFITVREIRILLNCSVHIATKIASDVRKTMIDKGMKPIGNYVLTKYVILYLDANNIIY